MMNIRVLALSAALLAASLAPAQAASKLEKWREYSGVSWDGKAFAGSASAPIVGLHFDRQGRAFVSTPRLLSTLAPATISTLALDGNGGAARLTAFPSLAANDAATPASALRSVLGFHVDQRNGWLWAVDAGFVAGEKEAPAGGQKLMVFDLKTGALIKNIALDAVADRKGSFLNDVAVDEVRKVAYVSDSGYRSAPNNQAGIIVIDLTAGTARRVLHQHPSVMTESGVKVRAHGAEVWPGNPLLVAINGIALSNDRKTLYWTVTAGSKLWSASSAALRAGEAIVVRDHGTVGGNTDGIVMGPDGKLYITDVSRNGIVRYDPVNGKMALAASDEDVFWPDTASIGPGGALYFTASNLNNHFAGAVADGKERYTIWTLPLKLTGGSRASR
jgi:sugar lactone lactonase YvrE